MALLPRVRIVRDDLPRPPRRRLHRPRQAARAHLRVLAAYAVGLAPLWAAAALAIALLWSAGLADSP